MLRSLVCATSVAVVLTAVPASAAPDLAGASVRLARVEAPDLGKLKDRIRSDRARAKSVHAKVASRQSTPRVERWTPTTHAVTDTSGHTTLQMFGSPRFRRTTDGWVRASGRVTRQPGRFPFRATGAVVPTAFGANPSWLLKTHVGRGSVVWSMPGARITRPVVQNHGRWSSQVTYRQVSPGVNLRYLVSASQVKEQLVLQRRTAKNHFTFTIADRKHLLGNAVRRSNGAYAFDGQLGAGMRLTLTAPMAWAAGGKNSAVPGDGSAHQTVTRTKAGYTVRLWLDKKWAKGQTFPIVLDPTQTYSWANTTLGTAFAPTDPTLCSGSPCQLSSTMDGDFFVGWNDYVADPYLSEHWGLVHADLSNVPPWTQIDAATLSVGTDDSVTSLGCTNFQTAVNDVELLPGDTWPAEWTGPGDVTNLVDQLINLESVSGTSAGGFPLVAADVTDGVRTLVEEGRGVNTNFVIVPHFNCSRPAARTSGPPTPTSDGTWLDDATLTIEYTGAVLPPPIPVEQSYGCDCRWMHGADLSRTVADPVNTANGHAMESFTDVTVTGPGVPVHVARTYNGLDDSDGAFGVGFSWAYGASLTEDSGSGDVTFRDPTGGRSVYELQPGGDYLGAPGVTGVLESKVGGGWTLTSTTGEVLTFDDDGFLLTDLDRQGRGVTVAYTGSGGSKRVDTLTDEVGRVTELTYGTTGAEDGKITSIETDDGRTVSYAYDTIASEPHLVAVTGVDGETTDLDYDTTSGLLDQITTPEGAQNAQNTYDGSSGRVGTQIDADGNEWSFDWKPTPGAVPDGSGVQTTTDPEGNVSRDTYYGNVLLRHVDGAGNKTSYTYDENLNLIAITDALGYVTTMTYDSAGNMLTRTAPDPLSYEEEWTYNPDNTLASYTDARGKTTTYGYDLDGQLTDVTDPLSNTTSYTYTALGQLDTTTTAEGRITDNDYDVDGNLTSVTSPGGHETTYTYDDAGRVLSATSPRGNELGATAEDFTTHYTYDDLGRLLTQTDPHDTVTENTYDDDGNLTETTVTDDASNQLTDTEYTYDNSGNRETTTVNGRLVETSTYNGNHQVASIADAEDGLTTFAYDKAGQLDTKVMPNGNAPGGDPYSNSYTYYHDPTGNLLATVGPASYTETVYDALGRPTSVWHGAGNADATTYDENGNVLTYTNGAGNVTTSTYDDAGRLETQAAPGLDPVTYTYDDDGNQLSKTSPSGDSTTSWTYNDDGNLETQVDPAGNVPGGTPANHTTSYQYDADGNLITTTDQRGNDTTTTYDALGNKVTETDPESRTTAWTYDPLGRVTEVNPPGAGSDSTAYDYDTHGDLITRTDANGHDTTYTYDNRHAVTSVTDPLDRVKTYHYDANGNLDSWVTARGNELGADPEDYTVTVTLDGEGKTIGRDAVDDSVDATYWYDSDGRINEMDDATGTTLYSYDDARRLTDVNGPDGEYTYTYTDDSQVESRIYPTAGTIEYTFNDDGLIDSMTANSQTTTFDYNANGQITDTTYPSAVDIVEHRDYDRTGLISSIATSAAGAPHPTSQYDYTRDNTGAPTLVAVTRGTTTVENAYEYNNRGWLTQYCPDTSTSSCTSATDYITYDYDNVGNRLNETRIGVTNPGSTDYTYDDADELESTDDGTTLTNYTYNADGQLTSDDREWNVLGQLTSSNVNAAATYTYDGQGNRRTVTTGAGTTALSWDTNNPLPMLASTTDPNNDTSTYRHTPEGWALSAEHAYQGYSRSYYTHDAQGSVTDAFKGDGTPTWAIAYEPFGTADSTPLIGSPVTAPFTYTGAYSEPALDDYHLRARDYSPETGAFTSTDPIPTEPGMPLLAAYQYGYNQPTRYTDPSGQIPSPGDIWDTTKDIAKAALDQGEDFTVGLGGGLMQMSDSLADYWAFMCNTWTPFNIDLSGVQSNTDMYYQYYGSRDPNSLASIAGQILGPTATLAGFGLLFGAGAKAGSMGYATVEDVARLVPQGETLGTWGNRIWGRGASGARDLIGARSAEELREIPGLTLRSARILKSFYEGAARAGKGGQTAPVRVELLRDIIKKLGG